jgi:hypothetical protein
VTIESELRHVRRELRQTSFKLKSIAIRKAARWAFDLPRLGPGPLERMTASLILAAAFGFATLGLSYLAPMESKYRLVLGGVAMLTVLLTSAVLILWGRDDEALEAQRAKAMDKEIALREERNELEDRLADEEDRQAARRERERPTTKRCPYCRETVAIRALKCRHCGEILDAELAEERRPRDFNPGVAAVLSFLIAGLGQMYKAQVLAGLLWFCLVSGAYAVAIGMIGCCGIGILLLPFAFILHVICIFDAASGGG